MAKEKELSAKEKEADKKFNEMQQLQMQVLMLNSGLVGANNLKSMGEEGSQVADNYLNGEEATKIKNALLEQEKKEAKELGINYTPEITNYAATKNAKLVTTEALQILTFGNLEKLAKEFGTEIKVAKPFRGKSLMNYQAALQKAKGDPAKLSEKDQDGFGYYDLFSTLYQKSSTMKVFQESYLPEIQGRAKQLADKYKPTEKTKSKK